MKRTEENRYPYAAALFKFCKEALELRFEGNVKVIDQDVGALLGYDPADCSHWKKGKKNIKSLGTLKALAQHLNVDKRLLVDILSGKISNEEALVEYKGYEGFRLSHAQAEALKSDVKEIRKLSESILKMAHLLEAPVYLPEILHIFPNIHLEASLNQNVPVTSETISRDDGSKSYVIRYRGSEITPSLRFLCTKELFRLLIETAHPLVQSFLDRPREILEVHASLFALYTLLPDSLLKSIAEETKFSFDLIEQISEKFWVSRGIVSHRLALCS